MLHLRFPFYLFIYLFLNFLLRPTFHMGHGTVSGYHALCMGPTTSMTSKYFIGMYLSVSLMHCLWDSQTSFFNKTFIKNGSHGTIHIFKYFFATVFLVFRKISCIQTDPKYRQYFPKGTSYPD